MPIAIVLAGGLGRRLRSISSSVPKPMIEIGGKPFLAYLLEFLAAQGIFKTILSVGYRSEAIIGAFGNQYSKIEIKYATEDQPLGTGGAIRNALRLAENTHVFVVNGDTYFPIDLSKLLHHHQSKSSCITIALKRMANTDRYGKVTIDADNRIVGFEEKGHKEPGLINGGIYLIRRDIFNDMSLPVEFSFEGDFLTRHYHQQPIYGFQFGEYFIDIGVPRDYDRARTDLERLGLAKPAN